MRATERMRREETPVRANDSKKARLKQRRDGLVEDALKKPDYRGWDVERLIPEAQRKAPNRKKLILEDAMLYLHLYLRGALDRTYPDETGNKANDY